MTITQMQYFVAAYEYGGISKAAEILHISQPSVSMAIRDLEKEYGITLFHRDNKQFRITQEGIYIYDTMKNILNQVDALETHMVNIGERNKQFCLGIPNFTGMYLLSTFVDGFRTEHPDIPFDISQGNAERAYHMLDKGTCSAAIVVESIPIPEKYESRRILSSEFVYCVSADHPLANRESVTFQDIQNEPLVLNHEDAFLTKQVKQSFLNAGLVPNILLYGIQLSLIREFVQSGKAGTFLTKELAEGFPEMVGIKLEEKIPINFSLVWPRNKCKSKKEQALINYIILKSETAENT